MIPKKVNSGYEASPLTHLRLVKSSPDLEIKDELFTYFNSREEALKKIDEFWRKEDLFSNHIDKNKLIANIVGYITYNHGNSLTLSDKDKHEFVNELLLLSNHAHLSDNVKLFSILIGLELGLRGINLTPILRQINGQGTVITKEGNHQDNCRGPLQELLSSWFLEKFIYKQQDGLLEVNKIIQIKDHAQKEKVGTLKYKGKEIDVVTPDGFVEVKDAYTNEGWNKQALHVFSVLCKMIDQPLKEKIKRVILIRGTLNPKEFIPSYLKSEDYTQRKDKILDEIYSSVKNSNDFTDTQKEYLKGLRIELYLIPMIKNQAHLEEWIKEFYDDL